MQRINHLGFILCAALCLMGFTEQSSTITLHSSASVQPYSERRAQDGLPQSHDPMWDVLMKSKVKMDNASGDYSITVDPAVKKLVGKSLTITGFMLPLEGTETFHHLLLSRRTPVCPFCPPGEPNEIMDVHTTDAIPWDENLVTMTGTLTLMNDPHLGLFYKLTGAKLLKNTK